MSGPLNQAALSPFPVEDAPRGTPEITEIHYDVWSLRITLDFDRLEGVVYVDFPALVGFRVLDESDLAELRGAPKGWLYRVAAGGWLALESGRPGFTTETEGVAEFLVAGRNDCVSVLALEEPGVTVIDCGD